MVKIIVELLLIFIHQIPTYYNRQYITFTGEGTSWHTHLIDPAVDRLLQLKAGEQVLDVACGNGNFARRMARLGVDVTACDFEESYTSRRPLGWSGKLKEIPPVLVARCVLSSSHER